MNELFDQYAYWKILRHFAMNPTRDIYVKELAKTLGISAGMSSTALRNMESWGLLTRRKVGQTHLYRLDDNYLTTGLKRFLGLFHIFQSPLGDIIKDQVGDFNTIALYGSFVRGDFAEDSDMDILVITQKRKRGLDHAALREAAGRQVSVEQFTVGQWLKLKEESDAFYLEVMRNHVVLEGAELV